MATYAIYSYKSMKRISTYNNVGKSKPKHLTKETQTKIINTMIAYDNRKTDTNLSAFSILFFSFRKFIVSVKDEMKL